MQLTRRQTRAVSVGVVLLAPLVGVLCLRAPLFNNLVYRDPWFYSGHGWTLAHHLEIFGWTYYAVRFPVSLPIGWTTDVFGPVAGYLLLRYGILVGTGAVLYACVRRFASIWVAAASVVMLALNAFYLRGVLWDYTTYVAIPCAIAGVAIWLMSSTSARRLWPFAASGALLGASAFANALSVSVVVPLVAVELVGALRRGLRELGRLMIRSAAAAAGAAAVFVAGYLGYAADIGLYSPVELVRPTFDFVKANDQLAAPLQRPISEFLDGEPRIYAPVLLCFALVIVLGRRVLDDTLPGRLAQYAIGYVALLWLYRFAVTSSVLETWWAYSMTALSMCFAVPLVLERLEQAASPRHGRHLVLAALVGTALISVAIRNANSAAVDVYEWIRDSATLVVALLIAGIATIVAARFLLRPAARVAAAAAFFGLVAFFSLTPARYIGIHQTGEFAPDSRAEIVGYDAAHEMSKLLEERDQPYSRVLLWTTLSGFPMVAWTNLPHQFSSIESPEGAIPALSGLSAPAADLVRHPTTDALLLLSEDPSDMTRAGIALWRIGVRPKIVREGEWADGHLHYRLVDVPGPLECCKREDDDQRAAAVVAKAYLDAHRKRDAEAICRLLAPEINVAVAAGQPSCAQALQPRLAGRYRVLSVGRSRDAPSPAGNPRVTVEVPGQPGRKILVGRYGSIWRVIDGGRPVGAP